MKFYLINLIAKISIRFVMLLFFVIDGRLFLKINIHRLACEMVEAIIRLF